jgi:hypothetical protein
METMADTTILEAPAGATPAETATPAAKPADATATPAVPGDGSIAQVGDAPAADATPVADSGADDWRKAMAGEDADVLKRLSRYNTPGDAAKALIEAQNALTKRDEGMIKVPGKDASEEDIAKFNKALGIPESTDKYEITIQPPEGMEVSDADKAFLGGITERLHAKGGWLATPEGINAAHGFYYEMMQENAANMAAAAITHAKRNDELLKTEWGSEHKINMAYANSALTSYVPSGKAEELLNLQLADGTMLGAHADFIKMMASAGRATTEDPAFLATLNGGESMSESGRDAEIKRIEGLRHTDQKAYDKEFTRYQTLLEQRRRASTRAA